MKVETCTICTESIIEKDTVILSCGHRIHSECMIRWIHECTLLDKPVTCMLCRQIITTCTHDDSDFSCCRLESCSLFKCSLDLQCDCLGNDLSYGDIYCCGAYSEYKYTRGICRSLCGIWVCDNDVAIGVCCLPLLLFSNECICFCGIPIHKCIYRDCCNPPPHQDMN